MINYNNEKCYIYEPGTTNNEKYFDAGTGHYHDNKVVKFNQMPYCIITFDANLIWNLESIVNEPCKYYIYTKNGHADHYYLCYNENKYYIHTSDNDKRVILDK